MKVFYLRALVGAGLLSAIADHAYGDIEPGSVASGARILEQETDKRQLRARADVDILHQDRMMMPSELPTVAENASGLVTTLKTHVEEFQSILKVVNSYEPKPEIFVKDRLELAWKGASWAENLTADHFCRAVLAMDKKDRISVLYYTLLDSATLEVIANVGPDLAKWGRFGELPDSEYLVKKHLPFVTFHDLNADELNGVITRFHKALRDTADGR